MSSLIGVLGIETTTPSFRAALLRTARAVGLDPDHLATVISFETGGSFSPSQENRAGSSAVGLIQFTQGARDELGVSRSALMAMSAEEQLEYVRRYFARKGFAPGKSRSLEDTYLAVFYPAAIGKSLGTVLFRKGDGVYEKNAGFDVAKKGYITVADVTAKIRGQYESGLQRPRVKVPDGGTAPGAGAGGIGALLLALGTGVWFIFRSGKSR